MKINKNEFPANVEEPRKFTTVPIKSIFIFLIATVCSSVLLEIIPNATHNLIPSKSPTDNELKCNNTSGQHLARRTYAIYQRTKNEDHLNHVIVVLQRLGYDRAHIEDEWDLLWAHDYPFFAMPNVLKNLQPHQMVNHFPGCGFITNKVDLSTTPLPFLPKAFKLPSQKDAFLRYINDNPASKFVEKHNEHRFIEIKSPENIDLDSNNSFVQEFIQNPFLVDGYKFDIGVYVVLTSVDPLRVYIYTGDVLFRYCPVKYHPFDPKNVDKYVVGDDYLPTWEVPSLVKFYNKFSGNMRGAFDAYVRDQGKDPSGVWPQVERIVRETIQSKEADIVDILKSYKTRNFFDLIRFDLIIDENLKVYLMEANMSPNLSSAHFKPNSLMYEQILYSVLNLVGVGSPVESGLMALGSDDVEDMISSDKNIATLLNLCADFNCDKSCNKLECELCLPCLSGMDYQILRAAYREHIHRTNMKRIVPKPIENREKYDISKETQSMSPRNQWMTRWFYAKCSDDITWCF